MLVGLQGSGKTTSCAKIARRLQEREKKKVLMASLDVRRPAAQEQLKVLGQQAGVATLPIVPGEPPVAIARRAMQSDRKSTRLNSSHYCDSRMPSSAWKKKHHMNPLQHYSTYILK